MEYHLCRRSSFFARRDSRCSVKYRSLLAMAGWYWRPRNVQADWTCCLYAGHQSITQQISLENNPFLRIRPGIFNTQQEKSRHVIYIPLLPVDGLDRETWPGSFAERQCATCRKANQRISQETDQSGYQVIMRFTQRSTDYPPTFIAFLSGRGRGGCISGQTFQQELNILQTHGTTRRRALRAHFKGFALLALVPV